MDPAEKLVYLMQHLTAVLDKQIEEVLRRECGIGLSQFNVLRVLEWTPRVSQRSIANSLGQTEAAVSRQVKGLLAKGLVGSVRDPQNRRKYIIAPTPRGMQLTETATDVVRRYLSVQLAAGLDAEQQRALLSGLQQLHRTVRGADRTSAASPRWDGNR